MLAIKALPRRFLADERGASAIEYGLIAAGITVVIVASVQSLGVSLKNTYFNVSTALR
jgi:pilus assembly protein Flp/PilA